MIHSIKTKQSYSRLIALLIGSLLVFSCSGDDNGTDDGADNAINVEDLISITVDENIQSGETLGTINATSNSPITFTISEQVFANAIVINASTGELTVGDASFFDFETNPIIQGVLEFDNGIESASADLTIDLINKDDIEFYLSESRQDYINAQAGDWIEVTEVEYNTLATNLNEVAKIATTDGDYDNTEQPSTISSTAADTTIANNNGETMPNGSYLFAFKYISGGVTTAMRAKQSSVNNTTGYDNIGGNFPMSPASGDHFLVLKMSNVPTTDEGHLAIYSPIKTFRNYNTALIHSGNGDTNTLPDLQSNNLFLYQGLSSTQKQWD